MVQRQERLWLHNTRRLQRGHLRPPVGHHQEQPQQVQKISWRDRESRVRHRGGREGQRGVECNRTRR